MAREGDTILDTGSHTASPPAQGLFLSHMRSARIDRHFERLVRETSGLVDWHLVQDDTEDRRNLRLAYPLAAVRMPHRHARMVRNGGVTGGYMDLVIFPHALELQTPFVWAMEYDVDYSGDWRRFFGQFAANNADLLTSTIVSMRETPRWWHWYTARSPAPHRDAYRAFNPIMRLSRRFLEAYAAEVGAPGWEGHYEYIVPTFALAGGFTIEDIGGTLGFCPAERKGRNYCNTPADKRLSPGTLVWRPSVPAYFHEEPGRFPQQDMLYHPVKPSVPEWDGARRWRPRKGEGLFSAVASALRHAIRRLRLWGVRSA